jgi:hypothetical protein
LLDANLKLSAAGQSAVDAALDNLVNAGIRVVRINDFDGGLSCNIFSAGNAAQSTTRTLDPAALNALGWFLFACKQRNIRVMLTLHELRALQSADLPSWACPTFAECLATHSGQGPLGTMHPWFWVDAGLVQLQNEFASQLLGWANPWTGMPIGKDPVLLAVTLQNEHSLVKNGPFFAGPIFQQLLQANEQAYCTANGIAWKGQYSLTKAQIQHWLSQLETTVLQAQAAYVRTLTPALVIAGTFYGDGPYAQLIGPCAAGDVCDGHFYSRYAPTDPNGFLGGRTAADLRSKFSAVLAGCSYGGQPLVCSEFGFVSQATTQLDPAVEQSQDLEAAVRSLVNQDCSVACLYAWGWHPLFNDQYHPQGVYDSRVNATLLRGFQSLTDWFHDLSLRPTTSLAVAPTNGLYGAGTGTAYQAYGPFTDPALYAVPATQKVVIQGAAA